VLCLIKALNKIPVINKVKLDIENALSQKHDISREVVLGNAALFFLEGRKCICEHVVARMSFDYKTAHRSLWFPG
jgi:hypothetical protein